MNPLRLAVPALLAAAVTAHAAGDAEAIAREYMARKHIPGMAYVILVNGAIVSKGALGVSDIKTASKVGLDSLFPIASLSKPFVAMGVLSLVEKGKVGLQDPVGKYLPELPDTWRTIPIARLLDHTSGVPDHFNCGKYEVYDPAPISSTELLKKLTILPLNFRAGDRYEYSNGNYVLLAKVIERASGMPYEKYLDARIFSPLGMKSTKALERRDLPNVVHGYENGKEHSFNPDWCYGNGALGSTVLDLAKLDAGLYSNRLLQPATLKAITTPQLLNDQKPNNYAMGWALSSMRGAKIVTHDGLVGGWRSFFARLKDSNTTVIVVSNESSVDLEPVAADLAGTVVPSLALIPIRDEYPLLTDQHRAFVDSILADRVDTSHLAMGLAADYASKSRWSGIREMVSAGGPIVSFLPTERKTIPGGFQSRYRLQQNDKVWSVQISWDAQNSITGLLIFGG